MITRCLRSRPHWPCIIKRLHLLKAQSNVSRWFSLDAANLECLLFHSRRRPFWEDDDTKILTNTARTRKQDVFCRPCRIHIYSEVFSCCWFSFSISAQKSTFTPRILCSKYKYTFLWYCVRSTMFVDFTYMRYHHLSVVVRIIIIILPTINAFPRREQMIKTKRNSWKIKVHLIPFYRHWLGSRLESDRF